jgi:glucose/arabinose dehydrogenase
VGPVTVRRLLSLSLLSSAFAAAVLTPACAPDEIEEEADEGAGAYTTEGTCDGLPRMKGVKTPAGVCVGVALQNFKFTRGIAELPSGDFVIADMGGWVTDKGSIWLVRRLPDKTFSRTRIATLIDKPSGVAVGPDGLPYVGTPTNIIRFDPYEQNADPVPKTGKFRPEAQPYKQPRFKLVVKDVPGTGRHPLSKFAFDKKNPWTLYVNVGSETDACETGERHTVNGKDVLVPPPRSNPFPCNEADGNDPHGALRKYDLNNADHVATGHTVIARGLRNSMALVVHPTSNALLQAENSRDSIHKWDASLVEKGEDLPHEEFNVIVPGSHYGWPYCYDDGIPNPEYLGRVDCSKYTKPTMLLPGHASPLGMTYYTGTMFPAAYRNNLIVTFHSGKANGHRLVMVPVDANGIPGSGEPVDIIQDWVARGPMVNNKPTDPMGKPVDVLMAKDGSLYVTEDGNGTLLRVFFDPSKGNGAPLNPLPRVVESDPQERARCDALARRTDAFSAVQRDVLDTQCVSCHGSGIGGFTVKKCDAVGNAQVLLGSRGAGRAPYVVPGRLDSELVLRLKGQGFPIMPAGGVSHEQLEEVESWIREGAPAPR